MERKKTKGKFPIKALLTVGVALVLIALTLLGACAKEDGVTPSSPSPPPVTTPPAPTPEVTPTPKPEAECPISCSADSEGWSLVFECEEEGQTFTFTRHFIEQYTEYDEGKVSHYHAVIDYEFETSGNVYHAIIDIVPCEKSTTGYCITVEATGDTLGDEPVTCKNF